MCMVSSRRISCRLVGLRLDCRSLRASSCACCRCACTPCPFQVLPDAGCLAAVSEKRFVYCITFHLSGENPCSVLVIGCSSKHR